MKEIILFLILMLATANSVLSTDVRHGCNSKLPEFNIASIGDSRAEELGLASVFAGLQTEFIQNAKQNGVNILIPNQVSLQNLAQVGATSEDWVKKIRYCESGDAFFQVPTKVVLSLGGNSIANYIRDKYKYRNATAVGAYDLADYFGKSASVVTTVTARINTIRNVGKATISAFRRITLKGFLRNPIKTLTNLSNALSGIIRNAALNLTGNPELHQADFSTNWDWEDQQFTDGLVVDMRDVIRAC